MYEPSLRGEISQGDIFDDLPIFYAHKDGTVVPRNMRCVLLTHDCEFDKPTCLTVHIARLLQFKEVQTGDQGNIRKGSVINSFYLASLPGMLDESFIDLRVIATIDKNIILQAEAQGKRRASLNDDARAALQRRIGQFFGVDR